VFGKALNEVSIEDIETVVGAKIPESRTVDYKLEVHPATDAGNKEFLRDVSAFANTVGGYLIYGVAEEEGVPIGIKGVEVDDFDKLKLRCESLLRTGVDPVIRGVDFHAVDFKDSKKVIVVQVPKSVARPHVVKIKKHFKFYGRNSSGVHMLEVDDLRRAFLASETLATRIRTFRNDRLAQIATGEGHMQIESSAKIVLHLIPVSSFELGREYDLSAVSASDLEPIYAGGWNHRHNYDGFVAFTDDHKTGTVWSYAQLFRNGKPGIPSGVFEAIIADALETYLAVECKLGVDFPLWVSLALLHVKGYRMLVDACLLDDEINPIDRDELVLREVRIEHPQVSGKEVLKPAFDSIWNACGYKRSFNYDENGNWRPRRR